MKYRKNFALGKGKYYLTIKSYPNNITLSRNSKERAEQAYESYKSVGKDVEWLGMWDGKDFVDSN